MKGLIFMYSHFDFGEVMPKGILKEFIQNQLNGITGHIDDSGSPFGDRSNDWFVPAGKQNDQYWYPYEQKGYWLDGALKAAYYGNDASVLSRVKGQLYGVLNNPDEDGYLGPANLKTNYDKSKNFYNRWPHTVMFRALMAEYEITKDEKIIKALSNHYLNSDFSLHELRNATNIEILVWLYNVTKTKKFIDIAEDAFNRFPSACKWKDMLPESLAVDKPAFIHGVTYCEIEKLGAILYSATGKRQYLELSIAAERKLEKYHLLVCGVPSSSEFLTSINSLDSHEICDISDYTWSLYYLFKITGDTHYLDIAERAIWNALPGSVSEDFKSIQYFSCPNQVLADETSNHNAYHRGDASMSYRSEGLAQCCIGNVNRAMSNYIYNMFAYSGDEIFAALYGSCEANHGGIKITEETAYPFDETVCFKFSMSEKKILNFSFRIPLWSKDVCLKVNGQKTDFTKDKGKGNLCREFSDGDIIKITFKADIYTETTSDGVVCILRGPLLYTLALSEKVEKQENVAYGYNLYTDDFWAYAVNPEEALKNAAVAKKAIKDFGFHLQSPPLEITIPAYKLSNWTYDDKEEVQQLVYEARNELIDDTFVFEPKKIHCRLTPNVPEKPEVCEKVAIKLIPYGASRLRITNFPVIK
ncbi:MAG: glycoside hydrolase family 127 protein [Bacillota bacterium]|nr:glycoside hydrolase family 127 protein [Bacillota bacterium]